MINSASDMAIAVIIGFIVLWIVFLSGDPITGTTFKDCETGDKFFLFFVAFIAFCFIKSCISL